MAEDKTFRYGLIVLGFFLVMVGMFIMSVDKPQIYITFCTLGILIIVVGVTWSMCQCYPKVWNMMFGECVSSSSFYILDGSSSNRGFCGLFWGAILR